MFRCPSQARPQTFQESPLILFIFFSPLFPQPLIPSVPPCFFCSSTKSHPSCCQTRAFVSLSLFWWENIFTSYVMNSGRSRESAECVKQWGRLCFRGQKKKQCERFSLMNHVFKFSLTHTHTQMHTQGPRPSHVVCARVSQYVVLFTDICNSCSLSAVALAYQYAFLLPSFFLSREQSWSASCRCRASKWQLLKIRTHSPKGTNNSW